MNKYLKPFEFFKELLLKGHEESPYPVFVGLYISDNHVSLARGDFSYLRARYRGYAYTSVYDLVIGFLNLNVLYYICYLNFVHLNCSFFERDGRILDNLVDRFQECVRF